MGVRLPSRPLNAGQTARPYGSCSSSTGAWPSRLKDVSEIDVVEEQLALSEHVDDETRQAAIARAAHIEEAARQRGMGSGDNKI